MPEPEFFDVTSDEVLPRDTRRVVHTEDREFTILDSGQREHWQTGAQRDNKDDMPRYDLIPPHALRRVAIHFANGAKKYDEWNWAKGIPVSRMIASTERHLKAYEMGDKVEDHLSAVVFNILAIIHYEEVGYEEMFQTNPRPDFTKWVTGFPPEDEKGSDNE